MSSRMRRAESGLAPSVDTAMDSLPRRSTDGRKNVHTSGRSATFTMSRAAVASSYTFRFTSSSSVAANTMSASSRSAVS